MRDDLGTILSNPVEGRVDRGIELTPRELLPALSPSSVLPRSWAGRETHVKKKSNPASRQS